MPELVLNTRQYIELMRSIMVAMTVDEHVALLDRRPIDDDIEALWDVCMEHAEAFGMSLPPESDDTPHWSTDMFAEADDDVHVLLDAVPNECADRTDSNISGS